MNDAVIEHAAGRVQQAEQRATLWRRMSFVWAAFCGILLIGNAYQLLTKPMIFRLTEINPDGQVIYTGSPGHHTLTDVQIENIVQEWIKKVRWRSDDLTVQAMWRDEAQLMADGKCAKEIDQYFKQTDPHLPEIARNRVRVKVQDFVRQKDAKDMYTLWWKERLTPSYGVGAKDVRMTGTFTVEVRSTRGVMAPVLKLEDVIRSPTTVFIVDCPFSAQEEAS
jgi:type IV secretory pathway TrbF-like protein